MNEMEILNHVNAPVYDGQPPAIPSTSNQVMTQELIEISSDEEDQEYEVYNGQPESNDKPKPWTNFKRGFAASLDSGDHYMNIGFPDLDLEYVRTKRQRTGDGSGSKHVQQARHSPADLPDPLPDGIQGAPDIKELGFGNGELFFDAADFFMNLPNHEDEDQEWLNNAIAMLPIEFQQPVVDLAPIQDANNGKGKDKVQVGPPPEPKPAPYYDDSKLEVRMYCGPGYEKFPIALGTIAEHKKICQRWDKNNLKRMARQQNGEAANLELSNSSHSNKSMGAVVDDSEEEDEQDIDMTHVTETESECLNSITEVLPDIKQDFALRTIRRFTQSFGFDVNRDIEVQPNSADIVARILDLPEYPKQEQGDAARDEMDGTGVTIRWQRGDVDSKTYQKDAVCLLAGQFDHIPTHFIHKTVQEKHSLFDSYLHLHDLETRYSIMDTGDRPYRRIQDARKALEKKYCSRGREFRSPDQWADLVNEIQAAKQRIARDQIKVAKREESEQLEALNLAEHKARGDIVECRCCFDDEIPMNRAVSCEGVELHWFCFGCVVQLAESQVGLMKYRMQCMDGSGCEASLSSPGIQQAVPAKLSDKLAFYKQHYEIAEACIEGLEQCAFCDFKAICDPIEEDPSFRCQNPECRRVSCRRCHELGHAPKSCEDAKKDKGLTARHRIEEARSEAMMRPCPQCKVKIVKELGCNKMRCSKCGCVMCYVCKADISNQRDHGYDHFNRRGSKCNLYDKSHDRHDREADEAEREAIKRVREENAELDEKSLQIGTGDSARKLKNKSRQTHMPRRAYHYGFNRPIPLPNEPLLRDENVAVPMPAGVGAYRPYEWGDEDVNQMPPDIRKLVRREMRENDANAANVERLLFPVPQQLPWGMDVPFVQNAPMGYPMPFGVPNLPPGTHAGPPPGFPRWDNVWEQPWDRPGPQNGMRRSNASDVLRPDAAQNPGEANPLRASNVRPVEILDDTILRGEDLAFELNPHVEGPWAHFG